MQTKLNSLIEQFCNVGSGFIVSLVIWSAVVVPIWNLPVNMHENLIITGIFTVSSVIRGFIWRRFFNSKEKCPCLKAT